MQENLSVYLADAIEKEIEVLGIALFYGSRAFSV